MRERRVDSLASGAERYSIRRPGWRADHFGEVEGKNQGAAGESLFRNGFPDRIPMRESGRLSLPNLTGGRFVRQVSRR